VLDHSTATLGTILFHDGRDDHWGFVVVNNGIHQVTTSNCDQGVTSSERHGFLDSSEFGNWDTELLSDTRVGTNSSNDDTSSSRRSSRETHSTTFGQTFNEHVPSESASLSSSQNIAHGDPNIFTFNGSVHKSSIQWHVSRSHAQSWVVTP
jgi:hypothetical protein